MAVVRFQEGGRESDGSGVESSAESSEAEDSSRQSSDSEGEAGDDAAEASETEEEGEGAVSEAAKAAELEILRELCKKMDDTLTRLSIRFPREPRGTGSETNDRQAARSPSGATRGVDAAVGPDSPFLEAARFSQQQQPRRMSTGSHTSPLQAGTVRDTLRPSATSAPHSAGRNGVAPLLSPPPPGSQMTHAASSASAPTLTAAAAEGNSAQRHGSPAVQDLLPFGPSEAKQVSTNGNPFGASPPTQTAATGAGERAPVSGASVDPNREKSATAAAANAAAATAASAFANQSHAVPRSGGRDDWWRRGLHDGGSGRAYVYDNNTAAAGFGMNGLGIPGLEGVGDAASAASGDLMGFVYPPRPMPPKDFLTGDAWSDEAGPFGNGAAVSVAERERRIQGAIAALLEDTDDDSGGFGGAGTGLGRYDGLAAARAAAFDHNGVANGSSGGGGMGELGHPLDPQR